MLREVSTSINPLRCRAHSSFRLFLHYLELPGSFYRRIIRNGNGRMCDATTFEKAILNDFVFNKETVCGTILSSALLESLLSEIC